MGKVAWAFFHSHASTGLLGNFETAGFTWDRQISGWQGVKAQKGSPPGGYKEERTVVP